MINTLFIVGNLLKMVSLENNHLHFYEMDINHSWTYQSLLFLFSIEVGQVPRSLLNLPILSFQNK